MCDHNRAISQVSSKRTYDDGWLHYDEARSERQTGFNRCVQLQTSRNARHDAQPVRGVSSRHCQGRSRHTIRDGRIVGACNLASANNTMRQAACDATFIATTGGFDPHGETGRFESWREVGRRFRRMNNNGLSKRYLYLLASVSHSPCGPNRLDSHFNGVSQWVATSERTRDLIQK